MPDLDTFVSSVRQIDHRVDAKGNVTIHFENGEAGLLLAADPQSGVYAEILEDLRKMGDPVYIAVSHATDVITLILIPLVVTVTDILTLPTGDIDVQVEPSQARHTLRVAAPNAERMREDLIRAKAEGLTIVLTETPEDHEIIDVNLTENPKMPAPQLLPPAAPKLTTVTPKRARELFELVSNTSCDPITVPAPCIPFLYPDNGCWARAHEMCRLILEAGESVGKCWIYGNLEVRTANHPKCTVRWRWHVAPVLQVAKRATSMMQVIDPSIFDRPVRDLMWKFAQNDPKATMVSTEASPFFLSQTGWRRYDPTYEKTLKALKKFSLSLKLRCISHRGPPPYKCSRPVVPARDCRALRVFRGV